jgi:hypothetical protein
MDENKLPDQNGQNTEANSAESSEPNVYEPQPRMQPESEQPAHKKSHKFVLSLVVLILFLIVGGAVAFLMSEEEEPAPVDTSQTSEATAAEEPIVDTTEAVDEAELVLDETEYYTLVVPEGFERVGERIFTFTGAPARTYSYQNSTTNDYFEVNIDPADSGLNADFVWTYVFTDGLFTVDKTNSTVCLPEESEWCEFSGANGRLDSAIFSEPETPINGQVFYFTFGNTASETVGDLTYVDQFLENIEF